MTTRSPRIGGLSPARAQAVVRQLMIHHFGSKPAGVKRQDGGLSNLVFAVEHNRSAFIVRLNPSRAKLNPFLKEQWACVHARKAGVPVPEILEVGNEPFPYMIQAKSDGQAATFHPERLRILRALGRYAARINSIRTRGFGATFDWSHNQLSSNAEWSDYLNNELALEHRLALLKRQRMASGAKLDEIRRILKSAPGKRRRPALNHGDLRLKNILVDEKGRILAILDWETCTSNLAPEWELSLALHDLSIDEKDAFLRGYGLRPKSLLAIAPAIKALNLINYAPEIERLAKEKAVDALDRYRARLNGALDLYSL